MFSISKLFWLIIIILIIWYLFKLIENKNKNKNKNSKTKHDPKNLEAFRCPVCGLWSPQTICNDKNCHWKN